MTHLHEPWNTIVISFEIFLFAYFSIANFFYVMTAVIAVGNLPRFVKLHLVDPVRRSHSALDEPVSMLVPAFNEESSIVHSVRAMLNVDYAASEVIVINDGSTDRTLEFLIEEFSLEPLPIVYRKTIPTAEVVQILQSTTDPRLRVIDKKNGGKGDAMNAGLNVSRYPLFLACDADSYYHRSALQWMTEPFQKDPRTVVVGGSVAIGNDSSVDLENGRFEPALPTQLLLRFQALEYLRAFLATRLGWAPLNGLGIISGACGLWRKSVVVEVGGYRTDTVWEDMEMTLRVHHYLTAKKRAYRVAFTPYPVCWTLAPETLGELYNQRKLWHRHLSECMSIHRRLFGAGGALGWLTMPYLFFFEWLAPLVVALGLAFAIIAIGFHFIDWYAQVLLLGMVLLLGTLISIVTILLDEISFTAYRLSDIWGLFTAALLENLGYRQFTGYASLVGFFAWLFRRPHHGRKPPGALEPEYRPTRS